MLLAKSFRVLDVSVSLESRRRGRRRGRKPTKRKRASTSSAFDLQSGIVRNPLHFLSTFSSSDLLFFSSVGKASSGSASLLQTLLEKRWQEYLLFPARFCTTLVEKIIIIIIINRLETELEKRYLMLLLLLLQFFSVGCLILLGMSFCCCVLWIPLGSLQPKTVAELHGWSIAQNGNPSSNRKAVKAGRRL